MHIWLGVDYLLFLGPDPSRSYVSPGRALGADSRLQACVDLRYQYYLTLYHCPQHYPQPGGPGNIGIAFPVSGI